MSYSRVAIIIGAGPAGLTTALELLRHTDVHPVVLEADEQVGGISRTVVHHGNRMDIGGHRFFSKSERVMSWWSEILPVQGATAGLPESFDISYQNQRRPLSVGEGADPAVEDRVMLVRERLSRILYGRRFYDYPISLSGATIRNLGARRIARIGASYLQARLHPVTPERSLEDFYINRFGRELYRTFFRDYTEKVWGLPPDQIAPDWGAQRVKGLSISKTLAHALRQRLPRRAGDVAQREVETSLIERFLYPKLGPGQMWEEVARLVEAGGGELRMRHRVVGLVGDGARRIRAVRVRTPDGEIVECGGDLFFSTMPLRELVAGMADVEVSPAAAEVAAGLQYRDFITVGVLVRRLTVGDGTVPDNWIYVQEPDVRVGRLQIFNNWSPYLVADPDTVWIGTEYFCDEDDDLWSMSDDGMAKFAVAELERIGFIDERDVLDAVVVRVPKTYPAYFGTYARFDELKGWLDTIENLYPLGRNGMHRYNNQDHSMLTAMLAVEQVRNGGGDRGQIWSVNTEQDYHEER